MESTMAEGSSPRNTSIELDDLPICPTQGCSLAFLKDVLAGDTLGCPSGSWSNGQKGNNLTTGSLCMQVVKPASRVTRTRPIGSCPGITECELLSYAEVALRSKLLDSRKQPAFIEFATHFVTHAWRYDYENLVGTLSFWLEQTGVSEDTTYFWIDVFVVNQHIGNEYPMEWWSTRFAQTIGDIGNTILVLHPWSDPLPLKRAWVIWEIFCTVQTGARLHIAMRKDSMEDFSVALIQEFERVQAALSSVDVGLSTAFHPKHRDMVHAEIKKTLGFTKLNEVVSLRLKRWLIEAASQQLRRMKSQSTTKQPAISNESKEDATDRMRLQENLARMLRESGNLQEAESSFNELLKGIERTLGRNDMFALSCLNQLAVTLQKAGKVDEALERHRDCLGRRQRILGENHEDTLQSASNLAVLLSLQTPMTQKNFQQARDLYQLALRGREASIGPDDPRTLYTVSNLASLTSYAPKPSQKLLNEAAAGHDRAVIKLTAALHQGHPLALAALHNQACHWIQQYHFEEKNGNPDRELVQKASEQLSTVHALRIEKLGKEHADTQETEKQLKHCREIYGLVPTTNGNSHVSFGELMQQQFPELYSVEQFKRAREMLHKIGNKALRDDLVETGIVSAATGKLTIGMQPFNVFARMAAGLQVQRKMIPEQSKLGALQAKYIIAHNKPECDEMWESQDPAWLGKASMSKQHYFLTVKDLNWEWFNILTFGVISGNEAAVMKLEEMKQAALEWVLRTEGWPSESHVGLFVVVYPLTGVPSLHIHIVDMKQLGPSYKRLSYKMLSLDDAIRALKEEQIKN